MEMGICEVCQREFVFAVELVPMGQSDNGLRPVCFQCAETMNIVRIEMGLEPVAIPHGAYPERRDSL